jgi:hypothetical protein
MDTPTPMAIGTPTHSSSTTASCYPYSPINSLMSPIAIEETFDVDSEFDELDTDTHGIICASRGGRAPLPKKKKDQEMLRKNQ